MFGEVVEGKMILNDLGKIAHNEWSKTGEIRTNIIVDEFIIMPNHVHGILIVNDDLDHECMGRDVLPKRLYNGDHKKMSDISPPKNSLSTVIRFFKRQTTIHARKTCIDFLWQPNYYDRIIRNEKELNRIREYIIQNPEQWTEDSNDMGNLYI